MSLGGKVRPKEQAAPRKPEATAPHAGVQDENMRAQLRAHVRQVLLQAGSRASAEGN